ncbi:hypothetical protein [Psychrilyobacter sp.]|uniref:hypothetical protein n=1 Tax=Psychrilyobacter sp. TaxID=2586924 RepID=UPI00301843AC
MNSISILSLIVAALAVFIGPVFSARSTKYSMLGSMRQKWINDLRALISEISSTCLHYFQSGYEDRTEKEYQHITYLEYQIIFMINPNEVDHQELMKAIRDMISALESGNQGNSKFIVSHKKLVKCGRTVLKKEWNTIKNS